MVMVTVTISEHPNRRARTYTITGGDSGLCQNRQVAVLREGASWDSEEPKIIAGIMASHNVESIEDLNINRLQRPHLTTVPPAS